MCGSLRRRHAAAAWLLLGAAGCARGTCEVFAIAADYDVSDCAAVLTSTPCDVKCKESRNMVGATTQLSCPPGSSSPVGQMPECTTCDDGRHCSGHSASVFAGGDQCNCICREGYAGEDCSRCAEGFESYPACLRMCSLAQLCSGHGAGVRAAQGDACVCVCSPRYAGALCGECAPGHSAYPACTSAGGTPAPTTRAAQRTPTPAPAPGSASGTPSPTAAPPPAGSAGSSNVAIWATVGGVLAVASVGATIFCYRNYCKKPPEPEDQPSWEEQRRKYRVRDSGGSARGSGTGPDGPPRPQPQAFEMQRGDLSRARGSSEYNYTGFAVSSEDLNRRSGSDLPLRPYSVTHERRESRAEHRSIPSGRRPLESPALASSTPGRRRSRTPSFNSDRELAVSRLSMDWTESPRSSKRRSRASSAGREPRRSSRGSRPSTTRGSRPSTTRGSRPSLDQMRAIPVGDWPRD